MYCVSSRGIQTCLHQHFQPMAMSTAEKVKYFGFEVELLAKCFIPPTKLLRTLNKLHTGNNIEKKEKKS